MARLTENFTLEELTVTDTGLPNIPSEVQTEKLLYLATYILQPIRQKFGPVVVHSGFRSDAVNASIGGVKTSQHLLGEAVDFSVPGVNLGMVFSWCKANLRYGQLIDESKGGDKNWIHVSLCRIGGVNQQSMIMREGKYELA